jgi:hypothetical protein
MSTAMIPSPSFINYKNKKTAAGRAPDGDAP